MADLLAYACVVVSGLQLFSLTCVRYRSWRWVAVLKIAAVPLIIAVAISVAVAWCREVLGSRDVTLFLVWFLVSGWVSSRLAREGVAQLAVIRIMAPLRLGWLIRRAAEEAGDPGGGRDTYEITPRSRPRDVQERR